MNKKLGVILVIVFILIMLAVIFFLQDNPDTLSLSLSEIFSDAENFSSPQKNITIRNVTSEAILYKIMAFDAREDPSEKELLPSGIHRYDSDVSLTVFFEQGGKEVWRILSPKKPYSFRYDDDDLIELWPGSHGQRNAEDLAPFLVTPMPIVKKMLELADIDKNDTVYDIGCGDGRIVIAAAVLYDARGVGIDIDPEMVKISKNNAKKAGIHRQVKFLVGDATKMDISKATVVTLYLLPESNALLEPKFEEELEKGSLVVSHNYKMPGWKERERDFVKMTDQDGKEHSIYVYTR